MDRQKLLSELRALTKVSLASIDIQRYIENISGESDRGVLILAPTAIEDALAAALIRLNEKAIAAGEPPPATAAQIEGSFDAKRRACAEELGIIDEGMNDRVKIVKAIRNAAAHTQDGVTFDTPLVKEALCFLIDPVMKIKDGPLAGAEMSITTLPGKILRGSFLMACGMLATNIVHSVDQEWPDLHRDRMIRAAQFGIV
jgi:hypothetical protein